MTTRVAPGAILIGAVVLAGCGKPPRMPARLTDGDKKAGLEATELTLADPLQDQAPASHTPVQRWRTHHMVYLNAGLVSQERCLTCHEPDTYCNNCHKYVGVKRIVDPKGKAAAQRNATLSRARLARVPAGRESP